MKKLKNFKKFNESKINEGRDAICGTCGEHGYDEDLDRPCSNCGDTDWTQDFEGADDEDAYESEEVSESNTLDVSKLKDGISVWGGDKSEQKFRDAFGDSIVIPKHPETGEVTYDGNKIGSVNNFAGLVISDAKWLETHIEKINDIIKETGFWYG